MEPHLEPTTAAPAPAPLPGILTLVERGIAAVRAKLRPLLVSLVVLLVSTAPFLLVAAWLEGTPAGDVTSSVWVAGLLAFVVMLAVSLLNSAATIYLLAHPSEPIGYREAFVWAVRRFWSIAWLAALSSLVVLAATAAFVIPGIIVSLYLVFAMFVLLFEEQRGTDALVRSTHLVMGAFWPLVGRFVLLFLASIAVVVVLGLLGAHVDGLSEPVVSLLEFAGQTIAGWVFIAIIWQLFTARQEAVPAFDPSAHPRLRLAYRVAAVLGLLVPFLLAGIAMASVAAMFFGG